MRRKAAQLLLDSADALWPDAVRTLTRDPRRPPAGGVDYLVLPRPSAPRWLLPAESPAAGEALRRPHQGLWPDLLTRVVIRAHRVGLSRRLPLARLRVLESDAGSGDSSIATAVSDALGEEVTVAVRLGSWDNARVAIAQVFGPDGRTRAFGKVGLDGYGRAAVLAERAALTRLQSLAVQSVAHPRIIHHESWRGLEVLLNTPLIGERRSSTRRQVPLSVMRQLAATDGLRHDSWRESGWWATVRDRMSRVEDTGVRAQLASAADRLVRSDKDVCLGCWHGDWTPWNMSHDGQRVLLWDWEHFAEDVPAGFDPLHFRAQQLRTSRGTTPRAERQWLLEVPALLGQTPDVASREQVVLAYLVEINLRYVLDRQSTVARVEPRVGWGLDLLRAHVDRLDAHS